MKAAKLCVFVCVVVENMQNVERQLRERSARRAANVQEAQKMLADVVSTMKTCNRSNGSRWPKLWPGEQVSDLLERMKVLNDRG